MSADSTVDLLHFPPLEIARQFTILDWDLWEAIPPWEFLDLRWQKKNKKEVAPNIIASTEHFNHISDWVATKICLTENQQNRIKILKRFFEDLLTLPCI